MITTASLLTTSRKLTQLKWLSPLQVNTCPLTASVINHKLDFSTKEIQWLISLMVQGKLTNTCRSINNTKFRIVINLELSKLFRRYSSLSSNC